MAQDPGPTLAGILMRGLLMGAADIVPGVSGGTMAFITGIYDRLLGAISAVNLEALRLLLARRWAALWQHVDGSFLCALLAGIATSVFTLARLIGHWLETQPLLLWSFFFGLILASALTLVRHVQRWSLPAAVGLLAAALLAATLGLLPALALPLTPASYFFAGFVAICAMILPGVSGSFILVLLGMYAPVLAAIEALDWTKLLLFSVGAGCGLLTFSRMLHYLLRVHHTTTMATLTGFLAGSLLVVWPWKTPPDTGSGPALPLGPWRYASVSGDDSQWLICLCLMALGALLVYVLETRWGALER